MTVCDQNDLKVRFGSVLYWVVYCYFFLLFLYIFISSSTFNFLGIACPLLEIVVVGSLERSHCREIGMGAPCLRISAGIITMKFLHRHGDEGSRKKKTWGLSYGAVSFLFSLHLFAIISLPLQALGPLPPPLGASRFSFTNLWCFPRIFVEPSLRDNSAGETNVVSCPVRGMG